MKEDFILTLIEKFNGANLSELNLNDGTTHLVLKRELFSQDNADLQKPGKSIHLGIPASASVEQHGSTDKITSPIVATYYASPNPDAPPYVKQGTKVKAGQTLCILEAMKMMNHLEADFDCEIVGIHASNGDLVEYDQILFSVKRL